MRGILRCPLGWCQAMLGNRRVHPSMARVRLWVSKLGRELVVPKENLSENLSRAEIYLGLSTQYLEAAPMG